MPRLAFIMAASHSSSTLLAMLLGSHPQATTVGDTAGTLSRRNPNYRCSCRKRANLCPFWLQVIDRMASKGFYMDVTDFKTRFEFIKIRMSSLLNSNLSLFVHSTCLLRGHSMICLLFKIYLLSKNFPTLAYGASAVPFYCSSASKSRIISVIP